MPPSRPTPPPDGGDLDLPLARALRGEETDQVELFIRNEHVPDGVFISVTGRPLRDERNQVCGGVVVLRDITSSMSGPGVAASAKAAAVKVSRVARSIMAMMVCVAYDRIKRGIVTEAI